MDSNGHKGFPSFIIQTIINVGSRSPRQAFRQVYVRATSPGGDFGSGFSCERAIIIGAVTGSPGNVTFFGFIAAAPLLTAGVWLGLAAYLVRRDRFRTRTEVSLLATCISIGGYALSDFAFLNAPTVPWADTAARASLTLLTLAATSFVVFSAVLHGPLRRRAVLLAAPAAGAVGLVWTHVVVGTVSAADVGLPFRATYDPTWFVLWLAYALACGITGLGLLGRAFANVRREAPELGRRMRLELAAVLVALALGVSSNLSVSLFRLSLPPLLSTVLVIPGLAAIAALSPRSETPFMEAAHRWKSRGYRIHAAFLTFEDGTLLGSHVRPGELAVDSGLFGSTLDVVQNFMRTSFPTQHGAWLRSITHGDYTLVLERGRATCLTVVLEGKENDQLRRLMRDALRKYERDNADVLAHWRGVADEAAGTAALLASLFEA